HQQQVDSSSRQVTTKTEPQKARDQNEVLEVGKNGNLRRDPADHEQFHKQREETPQSKTSPGEAAEEVGRELPTSIPLRVRPVRSHESHKVWIRCDARYYQATEGEKEFPGTYGLLRKDLGVNQRT